MQEEDFDVCCLRKFAFELARADVVHANAAIRPVARDQGTSIVPRYPAGFPACPDRAQQPLRTDIEDIDAMLGVRSEEPTLASKDEASDPSLAAQRRKCLACRSIVQSNPAITMRNGHATRVRGVRDAVQIVIRAVWQTPAVRD